jgi:hypothetical protein
VVGIGGVVGLGGAMRAGIGGGDSLAISHFLRRTGRRRPLSLSLRAPAAITIAATLPRLLRSLALRAAKALRPPRPIHLHFASTNPRSPTRRPSSPSASSSSSTRSARTSVPPTPRGPTATLSASAAS